MKMDLQPSPLTLAADLHFGLQAASELLLGRGGMDLDLPRRPWGALARRRRQLLQLAGGQLFAHRLLGESDLALPVSQRQQRPRLAGGALAGAVALAGPPPAPAS